MANDSRINSRRFQGVSFSFALSDMAKSGEIPIKIKTGKDFINQLPESRSVAAVKRIHTLRVVVLFFFAIDD